jgi:hypothetical protein
MHKTDVTRRDHVMTGFSKSLFAAAFVMLISSFSSVAEAQERCDTCVNGQACQQCQNGSGQGDYCDDCHHKWGLLPYWMAPDFVKKEDQIPGVRRWSKEDYYLRGQLPIGQRQKCYKGKMWPAEPRPTGPKPHMIHRFHAAHYWPYPYDVWSRNSVNNMIDAHQQKGWQDATTVYEYHFDTDSNELTDAGNMHIKWILENAPIQYRTLYLQTSAKAGSNDLRMAAVTQVAGRLTAGEQPPSVVFRNTTAYGRPAQEVDSIRRGELQSQPLPRITYPSSAGPGYGSGGS